MEKTPNRWDELEPGVQLALSRLINHIASMPNQHMCLDAVLDGMTIDEFRESLWPSELLKSRLDDQLEELRRQRDYYAAREVYLKEQSNAK